jgi:hypothetical protein
MSRYFQLLVLAVVLFLLAGSLTAQVIREGVIIPANQGVCDGLKASGVTPALYGLCVAYCEALDCPEPNSISTDPDKVATRQCKTASPKILARYNSIKKATDPQMACVRTNCPCWNAAELSKVGTTYLPPTYPSHEVYRAMYWDPTVFVTADDLEEWFPTSQTSTGTLGWTEAAVTTWSGDTPATDCQYVNVVIDWTTGLWTGTINAQQITEAQAQVCRTELDTHVTDLRNSGMSFPCYGNLCSF